MVVFFPDAEPVMPAPYGNKQFLPSKWKYHVCSHQILPCPRDCSWALGPDWSQTRTTGIGLQWSCGCILTLGEASSPSPAFIFTHFPCSGALFFPVSSKIFWSYIHPRLKQQPQILARILTGIVLNFYLNFERFVIFKMSSHSRMW